MTTKQIKSEIQMLLDNIPEDALQDLLNYLKEAQKQSKDQAELSSHLRRILSEDKELLEKLAK